MLYWLLILTIIQGLRSEREIWDLVEGAFRGKIRNAFLI